MNEESSKNNEKIFSKYQELKGLNRVIVDGVNVLANPKDARKYWSVLKSRLKKKVAKWLQTVVSWKC